MGQHKFPPYSVGRWAPLFIALGGCLVSVALWHALVVQGEVQIRREMTLQADKLRDDMATALQSRILALTRIARRWEVTGQPEPASWELDARLLLHHFGGIRSVHWMDAAGGLPWTMPARERAHVTSRSFSNNTTTRLAALQSQQRRRVTVAGPLTWTDQQPVFVIFIPIFHRNVFRGHIVSLFDASLLFSAALGDAPVIGVRALTGDQEVFRQGTLPKTSKWTTDTFVSLYGRNWRMQIWPTEDYLKDRRSALSQVVLCSGVLLSLLLAVTVFLIDDARRRARELTASRQLFLNQSQLLQSVLDTLGEAVIVADAEGRIVLMNPAARQYLGDIPPTGPLTEWAKTLRVYHSDGVTRCVPQDFAMARALLGISEDRAERYCVPAGRPEGVWLRVSARPLRDDRGVITGAVALLADISAEKRVEEVRREQQALLEQRVAERTRELVEAKEAAEAAVNTRTNFLANISHEIRTPINGIIGTTGLLMETPLSAEQRECADILYTSGEALLAIINDLLDLSKIEAGRLQLENEDLDLSQTIDVVTGLFAERVHLKRLELATLIAPDVPLALRGDATRLRQVLTNLVGNAIKYTEKGEVVLRVVNQEERQGRVTLRFEVHDTGIGLTAQQLDRLFEPFYQADSSAARVHGGTGLGLAICRQLVELMGGRIGVDSTPNKGSIFWFTVPLEKRRKQAMSPAVRAVRGLHVLVLDAHSSSRQAVMTRLKSWNIHAVEARNAVEGLGALEAAGPKAPFDCILMDVQGSRDEVVRLVEEIRTATHFGAPKVIGMTSIARYAGHEELRGVPVAGFVTKPVTSAQLLEVLGGLRGSKTPGPGALASGARRPRRGPDGRVLRVLLAEDNLVNQTVALRQLDRLGYAADCASNGREAVQALEQANYDVVLMDCQMPEMDGYQATAEIRRREGERKHTVIVALTAHALKEDRDKCLRAGMDDYISKPVKTAELDAVLQRWIAREVEEPAPAPVIERPDMDMAQMAVTLGTESAGRSLLDLYLRTTQESLEDIATAIAQGSAPVIERTAHSAAGANAMVGMNRMAKLLRDVESCAREGRLSELSPLLADVHAEWDRVKTRLAKGSVTSGLVVA